MVSSGSPPIIQQAKNSSGPIPEFVSGPAGGQRGLDQFRDLAVPLKKSKRGRNLCSPPPPPPEPPAEIRDSGFLRGRSPPATTTHPTSSATCSSKFRGSCSGRSSEEDKARERVRNALNAYNHMVEVLKRGRSTKSNQGPPVRLYKEAVDALSRRGACVNTEKRLGSVPGVEVGQSFEHWGEMMVLGVHHPYRRGIGYMKRDGIDLAISIVATDLKDNSVTVERILYMGEGGMPYGSTDSKLAKNQKLDGGNLALKNSMTMRQPVRVICKLPSVTSAAGYVYVYYGLYFVEKMREVTSTVHGKLVFQFEMRRALGQPDLPWSRRLQD